MGSLGAKALEARLARLEARVAAITDPEEQEESERMMFLHMETWFLGGSFEDIPKKDRDPRLWEHAVKYGPVHLGLVWEGLLSGREEYLADGVDFTRAMDCSDVIGGRPYGASGPHTPRKRNPETTDAQ
jgi:hypothetical protein